jgi:hypothetical protein
MSKRIYIAGPIFSLPERKFLEDLVDNLSKELGLNTEEDFFLAHRDVGDVGISDYQGLLFGAVFRTRFLEIFKLDAGLTGYISAFFGASKVSPILHFLYIGFLGSAFVLGFFVTITVVSTAPILTEKTKNLLNVSKLATSLNASKLNLNLSLLDNAVRQSIVNKPSLDEDPFLYDSLFAGFLSTLAGIVAIYFVCHRSRIATVKEVSALFQSYRYYKDETKKLTDLEYKLEQIIDRYT